MCVCVCEPGCTHKLGGRNVEAEAAEADFLAALSAGHEPQRYEKALEEERAEST